MRAKELCVGNWVLSEDFGIAGGLHPCQLTEIQMRPGRQAKIFTTLDPVVSIPVEFLQPLPITLENLELCGLGEWKEEISHTRQQTRYLVLQREYEHDGYIFLTQSPDLLSLTAGNESFRLAYIHQLQNILSTLYNIDL